ncbi:phospho-N-acetylmuramoyl-pentapeptide-transferase [Tetragenococcus koreensis]|uniref:Phospho-N-acetylmuramoyl-pentapeptide-transferase n=1 Tax=Tetragenococcus koreensis TaxID=290335 RepID=A0AAN4ZP01_9ENTE|nr:phospho-N-acetylmuramoyl-pentapeptide-transferase [Tetragenococcus koreensis]GEQ49761.1 phospho-N-acetylmuramoyl-pentapeptide transferase [Tetragenococcus koreensis]GEQ52208.1 phospho-N-acetylmuramoyl-pentapeptide transferase [Tetragenococcus koreensis]GEQ54755.1 phospho-N-acetylmuramoyl-pentapeptide transferase [Tetragenococcus koreensis]GEQ57221.1 phospho-N-acetylmuramoyl-pentapeptide transferase [Tetragenococcus koreensis]GEQ59775.1 phospho-N-acetylmuramoyl-pentapeptide transferase [Tetr
MDWTKMILPIASGFAITVILMPLFIGYFQMKKYGQEIRDEGPKWHNVKAGTPTMGGVVFLASSIITAIWVSIWQGEMSPSLLISLFVLILYGLLGFLDDFIKIFKKRNMGLTSLQKLVGQIVGALVFYFVFLYEGNENVLNFFGLPVPLTIFYGLFVMFWLVGFSNAVNLADGIDGLVSGLAIISFSTYAVIAWYQNQIDILIICLSVIGALVGFFLYNRKPAKIFMGDVGSLALGGLLAGISILLHQEWTLLLVGFVYVIETASVILQVASFKLTGKRIFKMSPIHHHFEMNGWSEWKIDGIFWLTALVFSIITLIICLN